LWEYFVPKVEVKITVGGAQTSNGVVFKSVNFALYGVAAMALSRGKLEFNASCVHEILKGQ
jgi:hypothetical protein